MEDKALCYFAEKDEVVSLLAEFEMMMWRSVACEQMLQKVAAGTTDQQLENQKRQQQQSTDDVDIAANAEQQLPVEGTSIITEEEVTERVNAAVAACRTRYEGSLKEAAAVIEQLRERATLLQEEVDAGLDTRQGMMSEYEVSRKETALLHQKALDNVKMENSRLTDVLQLIQSTLVVVEEETSVRREVVTQQEEMGRIDIFCSFIAEMNQLVTIAAEKNTVVGPTEEELLAKQQQEADDEAKNITSAENEKLLAEKCEEVDELKRQMESLQSEVDAICVAKRASAEQQLLYHLNQPETPERTPSPVVNVAETQCSPAMIATADVSPSITEEEIQARIDNAVREAVGEVRKECSAQQQESVDAMEVKLSSKHTQEIANKATELGTLRQEKSALEGQLDSTQANLEIATASVDSKNQELEALKIELANAVRLAQDAQEASKAAAAPPPSVTVVEQEHQPSASEHQALGERNERLQKRIVQLLDNLELCQKEMAQAQQLQAHAEQKLEANIQQQHQQQDVATITSPKNHQHGSSPSATTPRGFQQFKDTMVSAMENSNAELQRDSTRFKTPPVGSCLLYTSPSPRDS
eukprot:TRINITY_DN11798_c0_g1_i3.p1 TRINITY_DN11798_c0_g1~~TRINITY_DN11798_c0_g1_i3.p1  ORF type:complete len:585 (-),score=122.76 TRINITY_DN11798_c0_g1_i3:104-1858(-)